MVRFARRGDPPSDDVPPRDSRVRIVFEVDAAEAELIYQALSSRRIELGESAEDVSNGDLLVQMCRADLERPDVENKPRGGDPYRIVIHHCPTCNAPRCGDAPASDTILAEALCDAIITDMRPGPNQGTSIHSIPPKSRTIALANHDFRCAVPGCRHRMYLDVHHIQGRLIGNPHHPRNLVPLCPAHHRVLHSGYLGIERRPDGALVFHRRHGVEVSHVGCCGTEIGGADRVTEAAST